MFDETIVQSLERSIGRIELAFSDSQRGTKVENLFQSGCLKAMFPKTNECFPEAVLINTAGGLTGGDQLSASISIGKKCRVSIATQAAERIYRSTTGYAEISIDFSLCSSAQLDWLAQETIVFEGGNLRRKILVDMKSDSSFLLVEPVVLGRKAMGEKISNASLADSWKIWRAGKLIFCEAVRLSNFESLKSSASLGDYTSIATLLFIDKDAESFLFNVRKKQFQSYVIYI